MPGENERLFGRIDVPERGAETESAKARDEVARHEQFVEASFHGASLPSAGGALAKSARSAELAQQGA